ncbi:protein involved in plasmid replication-relaxation [Herbihabitans rhizosphaerae]|uniref:Protein involved in plasmid replication-relaxation n=1 Tax=Herbihabitans rhizosphaerae TaxID=1872711 RepID=A0A4Q7KC20_9PSEU|nr:replication-relaxation family protein [Herbihabitans rhizosphaerae]RZS30518.1 protein involved in plasmid replication-relaxation [Herbihabitans rhizosphaerae]
MTTNTNPARCRLTSVYLRELATTLPGRYTAVLPHLERVPMLTGAQLDRLLATTATDRQTTARVRRRIMARLGRLGLVATLDRRVGGARAGSAGHVYTLTTGGHRFLAISRNQPPPGRVRRSRAPGVMFLDHTLAISDLYVDLVCASRTTEVTVRQFATEPDCWHPTTSGGWLRPDAYTVLAANAYADCWWLEIDRATEPLPRIRTMCHAYLDHATSGGTGPDQVLPRVLITTPDQRRADAIDTGVLTRLRADATHPDTGLITAVTHHEAAEFLITELHTHNPQSDAQTHHFG